MCGITGLPRFLGSLFSGYLIFGKNLKTVFCDNLAVFLLVEVSSLLANGSALVWRRLNSVFAPLVFEGGVFGE